MEFTTLNTIINDLLKVIRASQVADTEVISKRQVEEWVHQYRALLLKQDLDKGKMPNPDYIQEINELSVMPVDAAGDNLTPLGLPTEEYLLRTTSTIPTTIDFNFKSGFMFIGTPTGREIQFIPEGRSKWQKYRKYTNNDTVAFLKNGYIYILGKEPLDYITVRGIFNIPPEVGNYINPNTNNPEFTYDSKYPIPEDKIPVLKQMILKQELRIEASTPSDETNDSTHNLTNK